MVQKDPVTGKQQLPLMGTSSVPWWKPLIDGAVQYMAVFDPVVRMLTIIVSIGDQGSMTGMI